MEIVVQGRGVEYFTPNEVVLNINFNTKGQSYEEVLASGVNNVSKFVNELLIRNGFNIEDMKTRNFIVKEDKKYIYFVDVTNRDGVQTSRLGLAKLQKTIINIMLDNMGITQSEFGFPITKHEINYLNANLELVKRGVITKTKLSGWMRAIKSDVLTAFENVPDFFEKRYNKSVTSMTANEMKYYKANLETSSSQGGIVKGSDEFLAKKEHCTDDSGVFNNASMRKGNEEDIINIEKKLENNLNDSVVNTDDFRREVCESQRDVSQNLDLPIKVPETYDKVKKAYEDKTAIELEEKKRIDEKIAKEKEMERLREQMEEKDPEDNERKMRILLIFCIAFLILFFLFVIFMMIFD